MDTCRVQASGRRVDGTVDYVGGEDVGAVGVWVPQKVGEGNGWEGIIIGVVDFIELYHLDDGGDMI